MFATRPESPYVFGTKKTDRTTTMTEAGPQHVPNFDGIDGTLGPIDPLALGVDPSDFVVHSGSAGGSGRKNFNTPLSGGEVDALLATSSFRDAIRDQVMTGKTAATRIRFHDTLDEYTEAFFQDSLEAQLVGYPDLEGEARIAARRSFAKTEARKSPAFTNTSLGISHIYTVGTPAFVTIHEAIHIYTSTDLINLMVMVEGLADYFTRMVCAQNGIPFRSSYADELAAMDLLAKTVGEMNLANFTFEGTQGPIRDIVDLKGKGTWDLYKDTVNDRNYAAAAELLRGAKGIHDAKTALETETDRMRDDLDRATTAARHDYERATWGVEGETAIAMRPTNSRVIGGTTAVSIERGGKHGVREHWNATVEMDDGPTLATTIVALESNRTYVRLPKGIEMASIKLVKVSP
jgi:hypothetical protein